MKGIKIILVGDLCYSNSEAAVNLQSGKFIGEFKSGRVYYNPVEVLYLCEKHGANISKGDKKMDHDALLKMFSRHDKEFFTKYSVYKDLKEKGFVVKAALKFGGEFRVYEKGKNPKNSHSSWILYPVSEKQSIKMHELASKNRVAHSTNKKLLLGVVDGEGDVLYNEVRWFKP